MWKALGRGQDGVVQGVNLLGDGDKGVVSRRAPWLQVGIGAVAVLVNVAAGQRTAIDRRHGIAIRSMRRNPRPPQHSRRNYLRPGVYRNRRRTLYR